MAAKPAPQANQATEAASFALVSGEAGSKFGDHLPLNRQEAIFARQGVALSRQTMCKWMADCAELVDPLYQLLKERTLSSKVAQADANSGNDHLCKKAECGVTEVACMAHGRRKFHEAQSSDTFRSMVILAKLLILLWRRERDSNPR